VGAVISSVDLHGDTGLARPALRAGSRCKHRSHKKYFSHAMQGKLSGSGRFGLSIFTTMRDGLAGAARRIPVQAPLPQKALLPRHAGEALWERSVRGVDLHDDA